LNLNKLNRFLKIKFYLFNKNAGGAFETATAATQEKVKS